MRKLSISDLEARHYYNYCQVCSAVNNQTLQQYFLGDQRLIFKILKTNIRGENRVKL